MASEDKSRVAATQRTHLSRPLILGLVGIIVIGAALFILANRPGTSVAPGNAAGAAASLTLPTSDGQTIALPGDPGQITVLYTMGYWCATCVPGAKALAHLQGDYAKRGVRFIAVDMTPEVKASDLPPFLQAVGDNHLTWALDSSGRFGNLYQITSLDTAIILDAQGREVYRNHLGASDSDLRAALDKLLTA